MHRILKNQIKVLKIQQETNYFIRTDGQIDMSNQQPLFPVQPKHLRLVQVEKNQLVAFLDKRAGMFLQTLNASFDCPNFHRGREWRLWRQQYVANRERNKFACLSSPYLRVQFLFLSEVFIYFSSLSLKFRTSAHSRTNSPVVSSSIQFIIINLVPYKWGVLIF